MPGLQLTIAEKIVIARKRLGETQEVFARRFNVRKLTVNKWESNAFNPTKEHLALLSRLFQDVLHEEDASQFDVETHQLLLPFDQPIKIDFRVVPSDGVKFFVELRRRVS